MPAQQSQAQSGGFNPFGELSTFFDNLRRGLNNLFGGGNQTSAPRPVQVFGGQPGPLEPPQAVSPPLPVNRDTFGQPFATNAQGLPVPAEGGSATRLTEPQQTARSFFDRIERGSTSAQKKTALGRQAAASVEFNVGGLPVTLQRDEPLARVLGLIQDLFRGGKALPEEVFAAVGVNPMENPQGFLEELTRLEAQARAASFGDINVADEVLKSRLLRKPDTLQFDPNQFFSQLLGGDAGAGGVQPTDQETLDQAAFFIDPSLQNQPFGF